MGIIGHRMISLDPINPKPQTPKEEFPLNSWKRPINPKPQRGVPPKILGAPRRLGLFGYSPDRGGSHPGLSAEQKLIVPFKEIEHGVYGDLIIIDLKPYSIYLRGQSVNAKIRLPWFRV